MKKIIKIVVSTTIALAIMVLAGGEANAYNQQFDAEHKHGDILKWGQNNTRVTGLLAYSCPDTTSIEITWNEVNNADSYDIEISRSNNTWDEVDRYTTSGAVTKFIAHFNYKSEYRVVDFNVTDTYYVRVRANIGDRKSSWSRTARTNIKEKEEKPVDLSHIKIEDQEDLDSYLKAFENMQNMYKPKWN